MLGSLRIIGCAKVARRDVTPPLPRRGERAITPAPTVASPGAAARLGPLGAILHPLYENVIRTPRRNPISPIGREPIGLIGRNDPTSVYWCEWWGDTNGDAVWTAAWRGQRRCSIFTGMRLVFGDILISFGVVWYGRPRLCPRAASLPGSVLIPYCVWVAQ